MPDELNYAIYLSYQDLPPSLKQCFLYFSLKPKKLKLNRSQVVSMWIGEGLVHGDSSSLEERGENNYNELISRNLIEPDANIPGQRVCNMHDVILSFARYVARDEALAAHAGDTAKSKLSSHSFLRLSVETNGVESDEFDWRYLAEQTSLRTLILSGKFKVQHGDSLISFSSLRILHIVSANFAALVESVCQLKHLRYLSVRSCSDISTLPSNIHKMKFLQYLSVEGCEGFEKLPDSIVELRELRHLDIDGTHVDSIPSGFGVLTNLKGLCGFPAYIDGDWCSLEELGPLSELKELGLEGLENVSATLSVAKARLIAKKHLNKLALSSNIRVGNNGLVVEGVSEEKQKIIEVVFDELCPPPCLEYLVIKGYFGRQLPRWMMWTGTVPLENLRALFMFDLACCTRLPDGLCRLPFLEYLDLHRAPAIKRVGPEFVQPYNDRHHASSQAVAAFPKLQKIALVGMVEWEEWEWKVEVQAMPVLEEFLIRDCKLSCIPPGLAFHARSLKKITIWNVKGLRSLENFASVVELNLFGIPYLTRISNFPKLQYLGIILCPKLEVLQEMSALRRLVLTFLYEERLPMYLQTVNPCHLQLDYSSPELLASMAAGKPGPEWDKFSHIQRVEAYAGIGFFENKWQLFYTRDPYSIEINSDLQEWIECEELEDDADVDNNQDENEEERKGHDLQERPDEPLPSGSGGLFRSGDDDEEDLNNNQGKSEN